MRNNPHAFYMPAEWFPHACCWMAWPCSETVWQDIGLNRARLAFAKVAKAVRLYEPVQFLVKPEDMLNAKQILGDGFELIPFDISDSWLRDTGPSFLVNAKGDLAGVDWRHNAWGKHYQGYELDDKIASFILKRQGIACFSTDFIMEGGSFHVDGEGTILSTTECLLHPNRNPHLSMAEIETRLLSYLGASKMIWLPHGLIGDETDGHVDEVATFIGPGRVLALVTEDKNDGNHTLLQDNLAILRKSLDAKGRPLEVFTVEMPPAHWIKLRRLTLSYINFYMANGGIVMPAFGYPDYDKAALETFKALFPSHQISQVDALDVFVGGGGIHCITQQQPNTQATPF